MFFLTIPSPPRISKFGSTELLQLQSKEDARACLHAWPKGIPLSCTPSPTLQFLSISSSKWTSDLLLSTPFLSQSSTYGLRVIVLPTEPMFLFPGPHFPRETITTCFQGFKHWDPLSSTSDLRTPSFPTPNSTTRGATLSLEHHFRISGVSTLPVRPPPPGSS